VEGDLSRQIRPEEGAEDRGSGASYEGGCAESCGSERHLAARDACRRPDQASRRGKRAIGARKRNGSRRTSGAIKPEDLPA
jgi:hypothetical protein